MLLLEPLHGLIYAGTLNAVTDYVKIVIPRTDQFEVAKSMVYLMRGLGMAVGICIGGVQFDEHGAKFMFRDAALIVLVATVSFVLAIGLDSLFLEHPVRSPRRSRRDQKKKKTTNRNREDDLALDRPTIDEYLHSI